MRPAKACYACRVSKRGCRVSTGQTACTRCYNLGIPCTFVTPLRPHPTGPSLDSPGSRLQHLDRNQDIHAIPSPVQDCSSPELPTTADGQATFGLEHQWEAVSNYFSVIHDKHHCLFHQPTFEEQLRNNAVPDVILFSMIALGARFNRTLSSDSGDRRHHGSYYAEQAHKLLDLRDVSVMTVQACILLGTLCFVEGRPEPEAVYYASANRLALILDLPRRHAQDAIELHTNLRVWWSLYMIDIWVSNGLRLPRELAFPEAIQLPIEEETFLLLSRGAFPSVQFVHGIWAEMARLARIWAEIQDLNKASVDGSLTSPILHQCVNELAKKLSRWQSQLPTFLVESKTNLERYTSASGLRTAFAALHLGFHYYNEVLYYQFLGKSNHERETNTPSTSEYAERCTQHALDFCDLLYMCEEMEGSECRFVMIGHMMTVTSTVYVHMLLFSANERQERLARERLERNFGILTKLQRYWGMLDRTLSRLQAFHNACMESIEQSFQMDQWMLRFILEHGNSLPEKFTKPATTGYSQGLSPDASASGSNLQEWYSRTFV